MVLNEIVGGVNYTFVDTPTSMLTPGIPHLFTAQCVVRHQIDFNKIGEDAINLYLLISFSLIIG